MPQYQFKLWHGNMEVDDLVKLGQELSKVTRSVWMIVSILTTDESVFEWLGSGCPVRYYIPRKPHPNGLLAYGTCTWTYVRGKKMPVLVAVVPHADPGQENISAQKAMIALIDRLIEV